MKILIIEDDRDMAHALKERLESHYTVEAALSGQKGIYKALKKTNDLIILDLNLPDVCGREVCQAIRSGGVQSPILILTGEADIRNKVSLLDCGADDYLIKPFEFAELQARIRALLRRRSHAMSDNLVSVGDLTLNITDRIVKRNGETISLRRKEFDILEYLVLNRGRLITRNMLLNHVWNSEAEPFDNTVDVHIKYLRDRIDRPFNTKLIKTVHGLGYRIET